MVMRLVSADLPIRITAVPIRGDTRTRNCFLFTKKMIAIHKKYRILRTGSLKFLWNDYQGLCYGRFSHIEQMIVVLNNRDEGREVTIKVWPAGITRMEEVSMTRLIRSSQDGYNDRPKEIRHVPEW